tara:strand:- start:15 stop:464 length:450 start_codon:yes stop_codon:yes gene_type:complete
MKTKLISTLAIILGVFFIYKGYGKINSNKLKSIDSDLLIENIIENNSYEAPIGYKITMNTFKQSGYLDMVSIFQIIAGILIIVPITRFWGLLLLLPIIFNIFFMHIFFDNRVDENLLTGGLLILNILLFLPYKKQILKAVEVFKSEKQG